MSLAGPGSRGPDSKRPALALPWPRDMNPSPDPGVRAPGDRLLGFSTRQQGLLLLIVVLGAALRLYHLGSWSIWVDEAHTWRDATKPLDQFWQTGSAGHPISYLILRSVVDLGAYDPFWLRLPFAAIGIATVPLLGLLAVPLVGTRAALLAALFLAVNPWHIYWSQNARGYVLLAFFGMLASMACFHGVRQRSWVLVVVALAFAMLAGLSHPSAYPLLGAFVIFAVSERWKVPKLTRRRVALGMILVAAMLYFLVWAFDVLQTFARSKPDASMLHLVQTTAFYFRPPLILAAAGAAALALKLRDRAGIFLALWAVVPVLLLAVMGVKVTARYAFISLPAVLVLASSLSLRFVDALQPLASPLVRYLLPVLLVVEMGSYDYLYFSQQHGDRPRWGEAVEHVLSQGGEDPMILTTNDPTLNYYLRPDYHRGGDPGLPPVESIVAYEVDNKGGGLAFMKSFLEEARLQRRTLFVLVTEPELEEQDVDGSVAAFLRDRLHQVASFPNWVGPKDQTVLIYR